MGIRLDVILIVLISIIISVGLNFSLTSTPQTDNNFTKELEFKDTMLTEVDKTMILGKSFIGYGVSDNKVLVLKNITYFAEKLEYIKANEAKLDGHVLYLKGDIEVKETDGYLYKTQEAIYNQESKILNIYTPFSARMKNNLLEGSRLLYNLKDKKIYGRDIHTVFFTSTK